jgi:Fis family transcriptional regulator, factor for inversion stimulation protein
MKTDRRQWHEPGRSALPRRARPGLFAGSVAVPGGRDAPVSKKQIEDCIRASVEQYFKDLRGAEPGNLHALVIAAVERPLLDVVMRHADGNQSKAAEWLGINRNTLRRKLLEHHLNPGDGKS